MNPLVANISLTNVSVDAVSLGTVSMVFGSGGLTQFSDPNGNVQVNQIQQNGFAAGSLQTVSVNDKGRLVGAYSNGRTLDLADITLANFNGANYLNRDRRFTARPARSWAARSKDPTPISPTSSPS